MDTHLEVTLRKTSDWKPLATIHNFPGGDADMTPAQMRALSSALLEAADECEEWTAGRRVSAKRRYSLSTDWEK